MKAGDKFRIRLPDTNRVYGLNGFRGDRTVYVAESVSRLTNDYGYIEVRFRTTPGGSAWWIPGEWCGPACVFEE